MTVLKVEFLPTLGTVVHVMVDGLRIDHPTAPGRLIDTIHHMPFAESAIDESVINLVASDVQVAATSDGYDEWRHAFEAGSAGVFTTTVADGVDFVASTLTR